MMLTTVSTKLVSALVVFSFGSFAVSRCVILAWMSLSKWKPGIGGRLKFFILHEKKDYVDAEALFMEFKIPPSDASIDVVVVGNCGLRFSKFIVS